MKNIQMMISFKKNLKNLSLMLLAGAILSGCASLHSVSVTRVPQDRHAPIQSESSGWGLFGIYFNNDFVNEAVEKLDAQCPNGKISGIMTKYSSKFYFFWTTRTIDATGYCLAGNSK